MRKSVIAIALIATIFITPLPTSAASETSRSPSIAGFYGTLVDLRSGWGGAAACATDGIETQCFLTEQELDQYLTPSIGFSAMRALGDIGIEAVCSTTVRLYANTFFGGTVLAISISAAVVNLSTWSFSNVTSSYKIGSCPATFYDGANAVPPVYPGGTLAGASATVMWTGWDNRVSSLYIS